MADRRPTGSGQHGAHDAAPAAWITFAPSQLNSGARPRTRNLLREESTMSRTFIQRGRRVIRCYGCLATLIAVAALNSQAAVAQSAAAAGASQHGAAEARIGAIIEEQVAAWNAGDAKAFSRHFAEDGSFTNIQGAVFYGHRAFEDRHVEIFRTFFKGTKLVMTPTRIRLVRPDVAIADIATVVSELAGRTSPGVQARPDGTIRTRLQEVFVKRGDDWSIASYHNVDIKAR